MDYTVHGVRKSWTGLSDFHLLSYSNFLEKSQGCSELDDE